MTVGPSGLEKPEYRRLTRILQAELRDRRFCVCVAYGVSCRARACAAFAVFKRYAVPVTATRPGETSGSPAVPI